MFEGRSQAAEARGGGGGLRQGAHLFGQALIAEQVSPELGDLLLGVGEEAGGEGFFDALFGGVVLGPEGASDRVAEVGGHVELIVAELAGAAALEEQQQSLVFRPLPGAPLEARQARTAHVS